MYSMVTTEHDRKGAYAAAQRVVEVHRRLSGWLRPGLTLADTDKWVAATLEDLGCRSCFLNYRIERHTPFPSHACVGVNDCIVHGTGASHRPPLKNGDLVKVDIGVFFEGWIGDAGWTYVLGEPSPLVKKLTDCGKECLRRGVAQLKPGNRWRDFAHAVQNHAETECGFHVVAGLGGHGYGRSLHAKPYVANAMPRPGEAAWSEANEPCLPGTLVAVEPMIAVGTHATREVRNPYNPKFVDWPVYTADGSLSVHYEHDVLITPDGPFVLTHGMEDLKDVIR